MTDPRRCSQCDSALPSDAPQGVCPTCLAAAGSPIPATPPQPDHPTIKSPARPEAPEPLELAEHFPQLEVLELLGAGGMGYVYKARQRGLDRLVALKLLPPQISRDRNFAERFGREARALARLSHPSIVTIHDSGQAGDLYYFIMEFIDGLSLRQLLHGRDQPLEQDEALPIVATVCDALGYAHEEGIVHRDIKPENILLDRKGRVKIADFGLAKLLGPNGGHLSRLALTSPQQLIGTPHYMAPEQTERPLEVDHRADIYSLGVVLYEMLTGQLPLGRFPLPSELGRGDARMDKIVLHALAKDPKHRYQRASEIKTAVNSVLSGAGAAVLPQTAVTGVAESVAVSATADTMASPRPSASSGVIVQSVYRQLRTPANLLITSGIITLILAAPSAIWHTIAAPFSQSAETWWRVLASVVASVAAWIVVLGAQKMKHLESRGLAMTACILSVAPLSPCWIPIGLPVGIWGLVILSRRETGTAFDLAAASRAMAMQTPPPRR